MKSIILLFTLIIFVSCNVEELAPETVGTNLADLIEGVDNPELINSTVRAQQVLEKYRCFSCHLNRAGALDKGHVMWSRYKNRPVKWADDATLTTGRNHDFPLINLVEPEKSVLVQSIRGCHTDLDIDFSGGMPLGDGEATPGECADLINWISDLAVEFPELKDRQAANLNQDDEVAEVDNENLFANALDVMNRKCFSCHVGNDTDSARDGGDWAAFGNDEVLWANSTLIGVDAGVNSHLIRSLDDCNEYDPDYTGMPFGGSTITFDDCDALILWVQDIQTRFDD